MANKVLQCYALFGSACRLLLGVRVRRPTFVGRVGPTGPSLPPFATMAS